MKTMKKLMAAGALLCALGGAVWGQSGTAGGSGASYRFSTDYVLQNFQGTKVEDGMLIGTRSIVRSAQISSEEREIYGGLGNSSAVDTTAEFLAMASVLGIQDVKKEDALKLYAEIAIEGAGNSFLHKDTTHSQVLARLQGKYNFTVAEIDSARRQYIAAVVDAEAAKRQPTNPATIAEIKRIITNFFLNPNRETFDVLARRMDFYYLTDEDRGKNASDVLVYALSDLNSDFGDAVIKKNFELRQAR